MRRPVEVACSLVSALDHDVADAAVQEFLHRCGLVVRFGEEIDLFARWQEKITLGKHLVQGLAQTGVEDFSGRRLGSKLNVPPRAVMRATASRATCERPGCGECGAHDMDVVAALDERLGVRRETSLPVALWTML